MTVVTEQAAYTQLPTRPTGASLQRLAEDAWARDAWPVGAIF